MNAKPSARFIAERRNELMQQALEAAALADAEALAAIEAKKAKSRRLRLWVLAGGILILVGAGSAAAIALMGPFRGPAASAPGGGQSNSDLVHYSSSSPETPPAMMAAGLSPSGQADQESAEAQLLERVPDARGVRFSRVYARAPGAQQGPNYTFCGEVNLLDPSGAYSGFQRFVASPSDALLENDMTPGDFAQAWNARCSS